MGLNSQLRAGIELLRTDVAAKSQEVEGVKALSHQMLARVQADMAGRMAAARSKVAAEREAWKQEVDALRVLLESQVGSWACSIVLAVDAVGGLDGCGEGGPAPGGGHASSAPRSQPHHVLGAVQSADLRHEGQIQVEALQQRFVAEVARLHSSLSVHRQAAKRLRAATTTSWLVLREDLKVCTCGMCLCTVPLV